MPPASPTGSVQSSTSPRPQYRAQTDVILYDGAGLNVDHGSYLAQHDVVYYSPALDGTQGMPIGDGDTGAMLWCPEQLQFQLQKSDLWLDATGDGSLPDTAQLATAGTVAIRTEPSFLQDPARYEQRLSLHGGVVTIQSDNSHGACQITTFMSATAGLLVVHYRDQSVRGARRSIDVSLNRGAHLFALGQTVGILQAFPDRRYALLARVVGCGARARSEGSHRCSLVMEPTRSTEFTVYVAVATSPRNGDPVASARSRIDAAIKIGFEQLLAEQRQHWSQFWEKSFLRLAGSADDSLPGYLENLWYLSLYQQACCSRGYEAPLANGGLWLSHGDCRVGPANYVGQDLRALLAGLIPANHLELSVPYVDTYFRLLPELAARTGADFGMAGARLPAQFNRFGDEVSSRPSGREALAIQSPKLNDRQRLGEGLETGLLVWEAWRHAPDPFFLRERAYPLLRACTEYAIERCEASPELLSDLMTRRKLAAAVSALLWADDECGFQDEMHTRWEIIQSGLSRDSARYTPSELLPFGSLSSSDSAGVFHTLLTATGQQPCGLFGEDPQSPDLAYSARLCAGVSSMLLGERPIPPGWAAPVSVPGAIISAFGGGAPGALQVFSGLPDGWSGAFTLTAPGGFRVSAEAADGRTRYVAVKSLLGGKCRIFNPWGAGERARVSRGRHLLADSAAPLIEFDTEPNTSYLIEQVDLPLSRSVTVRLTAKPNAAPKTWGVCRIGIPAAVRPGSAESLRSRLPCGPRESAVVAVTASRLDRARALKTL